MFFVIQDIQKEAQQNYQNIPSPKNKSVNTNIGQVTAVKFKLTLIGSHYEALSEVYCSLYEVKK